MKLRTLMVSLVLSLLPGCNAVVGGQCADGYEPCNGACVPAGTCSGALLPSCPGGAPAVQSPKPAESEPEPAAPCGDVSTDPLNCGACGNVCASAVCVDGTCRGGRPGDQIVIGHDFVGAVPKLAMSEVLANAVFMRRGNPVRVLAWQQHADPAAVVGVGRVLDAESRRTGRRYTSTVAATSHDLAARASASEFDVVLVFDQVDALRGELAVEGAALAEPLRTFSEDGGVVVVLSGGRGAADMPRFLAAAAIADVRMQVEAQGLLLELTAPADVVGSGVTSPYKAPGGTVSFTLGDPFAGFDTVVADPSSGRPVVLHRVVRRK